MSNFDFTGVLTALVTPFNAGKVELSSLEKLLDWQLSADIDGLVVNGTTAESPTLKVEEIEDIFHCVRGKAGGKKPIVVGTGSNCTRKTIDMTQRAENWGADAALVVTPYYNKPPQQGLLEHFKEVAANTKLPIILYNVPGRTITSLSLDTVAALAEIKNIVSIKEATGDVDFGKQLIDRCPEDFVVTSGDDVTCMDLALLGGQGVTSVMSNILPKEVKHFMDSSRRGDNQAAVEFLDKYSDLLDLLYCEPNPIPVKKACELMGLISSPEMRLPLVTMSEENAIKLEQSLKDVGLL